jgi:hypothetical protein
LPGFPIAQAEITVIESHRVDTEFRQASGILERSLLLDLTDGRRDHDNNVRGRAGFKKLGPANDIVDREFE